MGAGIGPRKARRKEHGKELKTEWRGEENRAWNTVLGTRRSASALGDAPGKTNQTCRLVFLRT